MLLHDDVVSDGQAKTSALSGWLGCEEGIEHLIPDLGWNPSAFVANRDLYAVAEVLRRNDKSRLIAIGTVLLFALGRRIKPVRDQVQKGPRDLLWEYVDLTGSRIKGPLYVDLEALL